MEEQQNVLDELLACSMEMIKMDEVTQQQLANVELSLMQHLDAARDELLRCAAKKFLRQRIMEDKSTGDLLLNTAVKRWGKEMFVQDKRGRKRETTKKLITISAKDNIDIHQFWKRMEKCKNKTRLSSKNGMYVLEQRAEGEQEPYGWHIHWLVDFEVTSATSVIVQQIYQCFTRFVTAANYIDVKDVPDDHWEHKKIYMEGKKKEEKMGKVQKDIQMRNKLNIPHIVVY